MPNTINAVNVLFNVLKSGVVASGNSVMTIAEELTSGDALMSFAVSGKTEGIFLRQGRTQTDPLTGVAHFNAIADHVIVDVFVHKSYQNQSGVGSLTPLKRIEDDLKITVYSGSFSNPARPHLTAEDASMQHEKYAVLRQEWRFRYLL